MSGTPKQSPRQRTRWLLTTGFLCLIAAACGVPINNSDSSGDPLPSEDMAQALANEPAEVEFRFQEIFQPDYTTDWHDSHQPFPSNPDGSRGGGSLFLNPTNQNSFKGTVFFEITPAPAAIALPGQAQLGQQFGVTISSGRDCGRPTVYSVEIATRTSQHRDSELIELNDNPDPDDPICTFIWPGILAQRILPPTEQPTTLDDYFTNLASHDFIHTHTIRMYSEPIRIYTWETQENGITEKREIGLNNDNRLFYINWWRSEPYEGENVNRRNLSRSCAATCD